MVKKIKNVSKSEEVKEVVETAKQEEKDLEAEIKKVEEKLEKVSERVVLGTANGKKVYQDSSFIKYEMVSGPVSDTLLPEDLRKYLKNKGFGTNVYIKDKEWLINHGADLEKIQELKDRVSNHCNK